MTPSVSPEADRELTEAAVYYAREGNADLGLAFIPEFERGIALLCAQPNLGAPWRSRRRLPLYRFPYSIIYYVDGDVAARHRASASSPQARILGRPEVSSGARLVV